MDSFAAKIETLEHQWMRAWMQRDRKAMKSLAARDCIVLFAGKRAAILDRPSWLEAACGTLRCDGYRFGEVYVRRHGNAAVFSSNVELEAKIGAIDWSGATWFTAMWKRTSVRRNWRLVERVISRPDGDEHIPAKIRELQLWR